MICLERAWMTISYEIPFNSQHMNSMCMYACMVCFLLWTDINLLTWVLNWNLPILTHSPYIAKTSPWGFEQSPAYECLCFCFANKLNSNFSGRPRRLSNSVLSQPFQPYLLPDFLAPYTPIIGEYSFSPFAHLWVQTSYFSLTLFTFSGEHN